MEQSKLIPLAFSPRPNLTATLYYVGFPLAWKEELVAICRLRPKGYQDMYGLPTKPLTRLLLTWLDGVVDGKMMRANSEDSHWLCSCHPVDLSQLCQVIQIWLMAEFAGATTSPAIVERATALCKTMTPKVLKPLCSQESVLLVDGDGLAQREAFATLPLLVMERLLGRTSTVEGQDLRWHLCGQNQLISQPLSVPEQENSWYSIVLHISLQTTPPHRKPLLVCTPTVRRWVEHTWKNKPYLGEDLFAHIRVSDTKYCRIPMTWDRQEKSVRWKAVEQACYNLYHYKTLPVAQEVLLHPECYHPNGDREILLPYHHRLDWCDEPLVQVGVSVKDKANLAASLAVHLQDMVGAVGATIHVRTSWKKPEEVSCGAQLLRCADGHQVAFEIYHNQQDMALAEILKNSILRDFADCDHVPTVSLCSLGHWSQPLEDDTTQSQLNLRADIIGTLGEPTVTTAAIIILPGKEGYASGDPKGAIRSGFAARDRVTQFVMPLKEGAEIHPQRIRKTILDLYRQLGFLTPVHMEGVAKKLGGVPHVVGFTLHHQLHTKQRKARFLPMFIHLDYTKQSIWVECEVFEKGRVSYREACLQMAKLSLDPKFVDKCTQATRSAIKRKLMGLKVAYHTPDKPVLLLAEADGNTRAIWAGLSDSAIATYDTKETFCPKELSVGERESPYQLPLLDSGVRMIRVRKNEEVPDYYTDLRPDDDREGHKSRSGLFRYEDVFWSVPAKPFQKEYGYSFSKSKITSPRTLFLEKDMIEWYPLQLQEGDDASNWVSFAHRTTLASVQYDQATKLPLPIHLGHLLKEYLF